MIRRIILPAAVALSTGAAAAPATIGEAAQQGFLSGCMLHTMEVYTIDTKHPELAKAAGLVLTNKGAPPDVLAAGPKGTGRKVIARIDSREGPVWIAAYPDTRWCMIFAKGGDVKATEAKLREALETEGSFWTMIKWDGHADTNTIDRTYATCANKDGDKIGAVLQSPVIATIAGSDTVLLMTYPNNR